MTGPANTVGILGAGTMGAGIAQVAAVSGWTVELLDVDQPTVRTAIDGIHRRLDRLVEKGRMQTEQRDAAAHRLHTAGSPRSLGGCELVIEAVVEDLDVKTTVLRGVIDRLPDDAIIATNTSSLSVSRLGDAIGRPGCTVGMHFFNPAPLMKLVGGRRGRRDTAGGRRSRRRDRRGLGQSSREGGGRPPASSSTTSHGRITSRRCGSSKRVSRAPVRSTTRCANSAASEWGRWS